jgi:hypothetical protein
VGFYERTEETLAVADLHSVAGVWNVDRSNTRVCGRSVHLHVVLIQVRGPNCYRANPFAITLELSEPRCAIEPLVDVGSSLAEECSDLE